MIIWIFTFVMISIDSILILWIKNNLMKRKMMKESGEIIRAEINYWNSYMGQPTRYGMSVVYEEEGEKRKKFMMTSSSFAKKYQNEKYINIVILPHSGKIYFEEEDWRMQNIGFGFMAIIVSIGVIMSLIMCYISL